MRTPTYAGQFLRDIKGLEKRHKDLAKLRELMRLLIEEVPLAARYRDHALKHNWGGRRDAHVEPDWVLIYSLSPGVVYFERTGSHEDIFEKS